jgi:subtilase family serine protease
MKPARLWALTGSVGLAVSFAAAAPAAAATHPAPSHRVALHGSLAPAKARAHPAGSVAATSMVRFGLTLSLRNAAGAQAFVRQVSSPGSSLYRHYLTDAQWVARFGPTTAAVARAQSWLRQEGFTVGAVAKDRLYVSASGTAAAIERAFGVKLGYYKVNGHQVRLAQGTMTIPSSLAGTVAGTVGINQYVESTSLALSGHSPAGHATTPAQQPAPPAGFRNPQPCSAYWGQKTDTTDSGQLYAPFTHPLPYDICGYKPAQLRGAYGLNRSVASGNNGNGVAIAIVDAYDSPTLLADAQQYFRLNDPAHPVLSSKFFSISAPPDRVRRG